MLLLNLTFIPKTEINATKNKDILVYHKKEQLIICFHELSESFINSVLQLLIKKKKTRSTLCNDKTGQEIENLIHILKKLI